MYKPLIKVCLFVVLFFLFCWSLSFSKVSENPNDYVNTTKTAEQVESLQSKVIAQYAKKNEMDTISIKILSGTGDLDIAKGMAKHLKYLEYDIAAIDYAPRSNFTQNTIYFNDNAKTQAEELASDLASTKPILKFLSWSSQFDLILVATEVPKLTPKKPVVIENGLKIKVLSGDGNISTARSLSKQLKQMGHKNVPIDYAPRSDFKTNTIYYSKNARTQAEDIFDMFDDPQTVIRPLSWDSKYDIIVVTISGSGIKELEKSREELQRAKQQEMKEAKEALLSAKQKEEMIELNETAAMLSHTAEPSTKVFNKGNLNLNFGLEAATGYLTTKNTNFGLGRIDFLTGNVTGDATWWEGYIKPWVAPSIELPGAGKLTAGFSIVGALTRGDGDAGGYTTGDEEDLSVESLWLGWSSGSIFSDSGGEDLLSFSYGRQEFKVGDGFLIYDGNLDLFEKGTFWLTPRVSFERAALFKLNTATVHGDVFYLKTDSDQDETELLGLNVEYMRETLGTLAAMYFHVLDSTGAFLGARDGMDVFSLRVNGLKMPSIPGLEFWAEYVRETGSGKDGDIDAYALYGEAQYHFTTFPWSPTISYRYSFFSGSDLGDDKRKDFDPFFYGWERGLGTWSQGEIIGNHMLFNSNQITHMAHLSATPNIALKYGLIYFKHWLDADNYYGTPVSDDAFGEEVNLYIDLALNEHLFVGAAYGMAFPGSAAEEVFGNDETYRLLEVYSYVTF